MKLTKVLQGLFVLLFLSLPLVSMAEMEIPYEVFKTEMTESVTINDGLILFYDPASEQYMSTTNDGMTGKIGGDMEKLLNGTFVRLDSVVYTLSFYNVGRLAGESYGDAELTIDYNVEDTYKIGLKSGSEILEENGDYYSNLLKKDNADEIVAHIESQVREGIIDGERGRKKISTEIMDLPSKRLKMTFSGGPFGKFGTKASDVKDGVIVMGELTDMASHILLRPGGGAEENYFKHDMYHLRPGGAEVVSIPIKGDGFKKWVLILEDDMGECSDPENPSKDSGIRFSDIWGQVSVAPCSGIIDEEWYHAQLDDVLHVEDHIKTGYYDSGAVLSLTDMTTFKMRENTEIVLSQPAEKESKIALVAGKVWGNLKKMIKDGSMEVEMSQAVLGIKGTTWIMEDDGQNSSLKVLEGEVEIMSKATGYYESVGPGEAIMANSDGFSEKVTFDLAKEESNWEDMNKDYVESAEFGEIKKTHQENIETESDGPKEERVNNLLYVFVIVLLITVLTAFVVHKNKK